MYHDVNLKKNRICRKGPRALTFNEFTGPKESTRPRSSNAPLALSTVVTAEMSKRRIIHELHATYFEEGH